MSEAGDDSLNGRAEDGSDGPRAEYARRREARLEGAARQARRFRKLGLLRLASLAALLTLGWFALKGLPVWWLLPPSAAFIFLADAQTRITQARRRCERAARYYEQGLARLDDRWAGSGETGLRFLDASHPYAEDLDLFGRGSLFELLSTARTRAGEETLARWLLGPATPDAARARQLAVAELRPRLDLREELALLGEGVRSGDEARALAAWAAAPPWPVSRAVRLTALALAVLAVLTLALWIAGFGATPFLVALVSGRALAFRLKDPVGRVIGDADGAGRDLSLLSGVLGRLEREQFSSPLLVELRAALDVDGSAPSRQIAKLNRLIDLLDARRNMIFAPLSGLLLWPLQLAIAIERWRQSSGPAVARWLDAVGEFEALGSLAGYAYERPHDPFPELAEGGACFE
ncbi:MAG: DNA mismatch repair protein MutS, partial [Acidobacteria bacterium]|nr:DNA mismatch repair protein MutS [Acidobacteriota bacterium]